MSVRLSIFLSTRRGRPKKSGAMGPPDHAGTHGETSARATGEAMTTDDADDAIPIVETYRGVGIHANQPRERIEKVLRPAIDYVHELGDLDDLAAYARDAANPPEARLFAAT